MLPRLLEVSAQEGARRLALRWLDQASAASLRLHDPDDAEALHDFRVAMRRLRSCLRAYDETLGSSVGRKLARRLKRIAGRTGPGRDAEVQLAWVAKLGQHVPVRHRPGVRWLEIELTRTKDLAYADVREDVYGRFVRMSESLRERLSTYRVTMRVGESPIGPRFGEIAANAIAGELAGLGAELTELTNADDIERIHRARIHGKRLRYLLEPFREELELAGARVSELKGLQDLLGDLHDLSNLAGLVGRGLESAAVDRARQLAEAAMITNGTDAVDRALRADERPGLLALLKRIQTDRTELFLRLRAEWIDGRLEHLRTEVEDLVRIMKEAAPPKDLEIERKYLLRGLPPLCASRDAIEIDQGYLPGERLIERLRRKRTVHGESYVRTVKLGEGIARLEIEEPCTKDIFARLWPLTQGRRVRKRRFAIEEGDRVWEIDEFKDRDLYLAEVELPTEDAEVIVPEWLAPYVDREVTGEAAYVNANLAR
jgi:CHAD domain-containing protein/CYTH domain-containing protein